MAATTPGQRATTGPRLPLHLGLCLLALLHAPPARPAEVTVSRLDRAPTLEDFLEMRPPADLQTQLARVEGFVQQEPEDGQPASQQTEVYLGYDDQQLYVIFVAFDDDPTQIRSHLSRRENVFGDETVEIQLDTFHDQRRAFSFLTNPLGVQWDAIFTEGQGFDDSWDAVWQSRGKVTDRGYVVWMAIPFKSLRFPPRPEQTWGLVFVRDIPRNNEVSFWPRVSSRISGRLNQAATLHGLREISPGRNLQLIPYATARRARSVDPVAQRLTREDFDPDAGLDAKFVIRDSFSVDLTLNPDFNQVESDAPQVTVNERFEVFFPEKRPFFLENADYFNTPFNLLFTRRIGEPRAGARLTGKAGAYAVGALIIDDEAPGQTDGGERARFAVLRGTRDISSQSNLGILYTDRQFGSGGNRVGGVDGRFKIGDHWDASFQLVHSATRETDGRRLSDPAYNLMFNRNGRKFDTHIHYQEVGRDFRTQAGFVPRTDFRDLHNSSNYRFRPEGRRLVAWGPDLMVREIRDHNGTRLDWTINPEFEWEFRGQTRLGLSHRRGRERLREGRDGVSQTRDYRRHLTGVSFATRFINAVEFEIDLFAGRGINFLPFQPDPLIAVDPQPADITGAELELTLRPTRGLAIENRYLMTRLADPQVGGRLFTNQIARSRWNWQLDRRLSLRMILQYESLRAGSGRTSLTDRRDLDVDVLGTYLINPWTAVYLGYLSRYQSPDPLDPLGRPELETFRNYERQLFVKVTYLFRL